LQSHQNNVAGETFLFTYLLSDNLMPGAMVIQWRCDTCRDFVKIKCKKRAYEVPNQTDRTS